MEGVRAGVKNKNFTHAARPARGAKESRTKQRLPPLFRIFATLFEKEVVLLVNIILPLSFVELLLQVLLNSCRLQRPTNLARASSTTPTNLLISTNQPFGPPAPEGRRA